ncbi:MAG: bifunctional 5,10-methylenetetrahydrofolate dehydrogenase/5,10-methenyltetrahydrofolate cyclohydrolase [Microthrixaceae bacterium]|nr:bifunctional 5,10-methylenetetrahydrofolate dehydrogenase/5,10-methenyltetrahydrofolate cyclohydrolase [Microthrixaceae bacterium]
MAAQKLDGQALADRMKSDLAVRVSELGRPGVLSDSGRPPGLGTILVGDDGPSARYVAGKHQDCADIGMASVHRHLPTETTQAQLDEAVAEMNADQRVDAFILQYPVPDQLDFEAAMLAMDPAKDADGLHPVNLGKLVMGERAPLPCTPHGILTLLAEHGVELAGKHLVVVGRGLTIGRPLALLAALKRPMANAAVTVVHTGVDDLGAYTRTADVIVAAAGSPGLITAEMVRPGAAVVSAGVTMEGRRVLSDVADDVAEVAGWLSPRIGGVGPMTRAMLLFNTVEAAAATAGTV